MIKTKYPQICMSRNTYNALYGLKKELHIFSFNEVLEILIKEHEEKK